MSTRTLRVLPSIAIAASAWLALFPISSVDAYYHLATGRRILEDRAIPDRGVGSATFGTVAWHDNEWGFQVLTALIGRAERESNGVLTLTSGGRVALVAMRAIAVAATLALLAAAMARTGAGPVLSALSVWLVAFLTFGNLFWDVRPQIASYVALAALVGLLELAREGKRLALPAAVLVIALWANLHGAFVVGLGLLMCEAAGAWIEARHDAAPRVAAWSLTLAALGAPLAACVNPLGVSQLIHPFIYLRHPEIFSANNEWTRPDLVHLPLMVSTFGLLAAAVVAGARPRPGHLLRVLLFSGLFLTAIRHLPLVAIVIVPVLASALVQLSRGPGRRRLFDPGSAAWGGRGRRTALAVGLAAGIVGLSGAKFIGLVPSFEERPSRALPEAHVRFLAAHGVPGNGFNAYRFGGFLMFRLYPQERVFIDGRNDLYGTFRTQVYNRILNTEPGWESVWDDVVSRDRVGWVLIDADDPLATSLERSPRWRRVPDERLADDPRFRPDGIVLFLPTEAGHQDAETKPSS